MQLRKQRAELSKEVTDLINELGPELFPDFDRMRIIHTEEGQMAKSPTSPDSRGRSWTDVFYTIRSGEASPTDGHSRTASAGIGGGSSFAGHIPRNESFRNLANIGLFASHPQTPTSRSQPASRSSSRPRSSGGLFGSLGKGFSRLDEQGALDDVSKRIRGAMQERGLKRRTTETHGSGTEDLVADAGDDGDASDGESTTSGATTPSSEAFEVKKHV